MLDGGVPDNIVVVRCGTISVMGQRGYPVAGALLDCAVLPSGSWFKLVGVLAEPNLLQEITSYKAPP